MPHPFFSDRDNVAERRKALRQTTVLGPDEIVLWKGRPKRGIVFVVSDVLLIPFSAFWAAIAGQGAIRTLWNPANSGGFFLHSLLFLAAGSYITIGRFLADAIYRSRLRYVVTNQRVIIVNGLPGGKVTSVDRSAVSLRLEEGSNGRGTIRLSQNDGWDFFYLAPLHACAFSSPHLFRIKEARKVYELLRSAGPAH